ncbi:MAG: hypothetical protein IJ635_07440 [Bacteroidaceae bacterium]|nr:hypothetical protein [Bacteroidaceae bacterium]
MKYKTIIHHSLWVLWWTIQGVLFVLSNSFTGLGFVGPLLFIIALLSIIPKQINYRCLGRSLLLCYAIASIFLAILLQIDNPTTFGRILPFVIAVINIIGLFVSLYKD